MATKILKKKAEAKKEEMKFPEGEYFYAVGKRKTSIAQVRVYLASKGYQGIMVNGKKMEKYFTLDRLRDAVAAPLVAVGQDGKADVLVKVVGGGFTGQAEATRLGIARALIKFDVTLKKTLRDLGFLTRDARVVERKKPGLRKARRSPQWAKR